MARAESRDDVSLWLGSLGFVRGNPFEHVEADSERRLLPEFFVAVDGYDEVKEAGSIIVFAPRGGGKSAMRVMLASESAPIEPDADQLAVEFTDFDPYLWRLSQGDVLTVYDYENQLLARTTEALWQTLVGDGDEQRNGLMRRRQAQRAAGVSTVVRAQLARTLKLYAPEAHSPTRLYAQLCALAPQMCLPGGALQGPAFNQYTAECRLRDFVARQPELRDEPVAQLLAEVHDLAPDVDRPAGQPVRQLRSVVELAGLLGITAVHFLVDRVDEHPETSDNPGRQAQLVRPLLGHLPLLEMEQVAFKFFLPEMVRRELLSWPALRRDRVKVAAVSVRWSPDRLRALLATRLAVYSTDEATGEPAVTDLAQICRDQDVNLAEIIVGEMVALAGGSPRELLRLGQALAEAHVALHGLDGPIELTDWELVRQRWGQTLAAPMTASVGEPDRELKKDAESSPVGKATVEPVGPVTPPRLRVNLAANLVLLGERAIHLTPIQLEIMRALVERDGRCPREDLVDDVWSGGITDYAVDRQISRLRKKLGDSADDPLYIETIRGWGFNLLHYERVDVDPPEQPEAGT